MKSLKDQPHHNPDKRRSVVYNPGLLCMIAACAMITLTSNEVFGSAQSAKDNSTGVLLGVFHEGSQTDLKPIKELEKGLNKKFASVMWFTDWTTGFPAADAKRVSKAGYIPHIAWEPWSWNNKDLIKLQDILDGKWDTYIKTWAADAAKFKRPLLLRWAHEFNGDWYPWSVPKNNEDPQVYIKTYRYVHDIFSAAGAKTCNGSGVLMLPVFPLNPGMHRLRRIPAIPMSTGLELMATTFPEQTVSDQFSKQHIQKYSHQSKNQS